MQKSSSIVELCKIAAEIGVVKESSWYKESRRVRSD